MKGLQFWQTQSHAIILHDSVPADRIEQVVCLQGHKILCQSIPTPRPAPKMVLKNASHVNSTRRSGGTYSQNCVMKTPRFAFSELHFGEFPDQMTFSLAESTSRPKCA